MHIEDFESELELDSLLSVDNGHGILLSKEEAAQLQQYGFQLETYSSISNLITDIENYLEESDIEEEELEYILEILSEYHYYHETHK